MNGDARLPIARAHPQIVGGNGADFRDLQMRCDVRADAVNRVDRFNSMLSGHEILALKLLAAAGRELHPKMRQSLVPRTGNTELRRAVDGGEVFNGVKIS